MHGKRYHIGIIIHVLNDIILIATVKVFKRIVMVLVHQISKLGDYHLRSTGSAGVNFDEGIANAIISAPRRELVYKIFVRSLP